MLKRVVARSIPRTFDSHSFPKTVSQKRHEVMDETQQALRHKRYARAPADRSHKPKLKGLRRPPDNAISHVLSFMLRHGAINHGLDMRQDGFVKVADLLAMPQFSLIDFPILERVVKEDKKNRYTLRVEPGTEDTWWIRANQGHSLKGLNIEMTRITDVGQIRMAVHGTSKAAWDRIAIEGLSRMKREYVHFAQGFAGQHVVSGMRNGSQIYIYLNVPLVLRSNLELLLSSNGVVQCAGDEAGLISPRFFGRVEWAGNRQALTGWEGPRESTPPAVEPEEDLQDTTDAPTR